MSNSSEGQDGFGYVSVAKAREEGRGLAEINPRSMVAKGSSNFEPIDDGHGCANHIWNF